MARKLKPRDMVTIDAGKHAGRWGFVDKVGKEKVTVFVQCDGMSITKKYKPSSLTLIPAIGLDAETIRALVRRETTIDEVCKGQPRPNYYPAGEYQMTLEDLEAALTALTALGDEDEGEAEGWYWLTLEELYANAGLWKCMNRPADKGAGQDEDAIEAMPDSYSVFSEVYDELSNRFAFNEPAASLQELLEWVRTYKRDCGKPAIERELTTRQKERFIEHWDNQRVEAFGTPEVEELYVKYVTELAAEGSPRGLEELAYATYGKGNAGFDEDWETSRDCLLRLEKVSPKASYANTLGYIYYYGRCNDGEPQYDEAFKWFAVGAAGGIYESRYKLSDMFREGNGCVKDTEIAAHIVWDLYNDNLEYFRHGIANTKFADIALRMGHLYRDGIDCVENPRQAYSHYLMAKTAIRMRRMAGDWYGDASVEHKIDEAIASVIEGSGYAEPVDKCVFTELNWLLGLALCDGRRMRMDWKRGKKGKFKLAFTMEDRPGATYRSKVPVLIPEAQLCGFVEKLEVKVDTAGCEVEGLEGDKGSVVFDEVANEWPGYGALLLYGEQTVRFQGLFTIDCRKLKGELRRYVDVHFEDPHRAWSYLCDDEEIGEGAKVRVPWGKEEREGTVLRVTERYDSEVALWRRDYKRVIERLG